MATKGAVIFDGDDTLWAVEHLYDAALDNAEATVSASGLPGTEWRTVQRELDLENVHTLGMSRYRFPLSSKQALLEIGRRHGVTPSAELIGAVVTASRSVFDMEAPVVEGAADTLRALTPHFHVALLTKGDELIQWRRIEQSGLRRWLEHIEVVREKTESIFRELVEHFDSPLNQSWSIGNSVASDINPALRAGLNAIWIDAHVWEHELREATPAGSQVITLDRLDQVVDVLLTPARTGGRSR